MRTDSEILKLFDEVFKETNLDYYVDKLEFRHKGFFDIKFYVQNLGTVLDSFDYESLKETLIDVKLKILKNPFKCPFCSSLEIKGDICNCGAKYIKSNRSKGLADEDLITSYNKFDEFSKEIEKKTKISQDVLNIYASLDGKCSDILSGVDVIYEGMLKYPIFVLADQITLKKEINEESRKLLYYSKLIEESNASYYMTYDYYYKKTDINLELDMDNCKILVKFENDYYPVTSKEIISNGKLNILVPFDINNIMDIYKEKYNLKSDDDDYDDIVNELNDWVIDNYVDGFSEFIDGDFYILNELDISINNDNYENFLYYVKKAIQQNINRSDLCKNTAINNLHEFHLSREC